MYGSFILSMKVTDDLFQLIKSLDKNERRYFRLFASMQSGSKQYMKLFEAIDAQSTYSEEEIRARFADQQFVRQLAVAKNYLYNLILKCLGLYHAGYGNQIDRMLQQAEILRRRALYRQALKLVERAERLAEETGDDGRLLLVLAERRELLVKVSPTRWSRTRHDDYVRLRRALDALACTAQAAMTDEEPGTGLGAHDPFGTSGGMISADPVHAETAGRGMMLSRPEPRDPALASAPEDAEGSSRRASGEARIEILREMLIRAVVTGASEIATEAREELLATVRSSDVRADDVRLTAMAALEIASLLDSFSGDAAEPAGAMTLLTREGGRLVVRDVLQIRLLITLHHLFRGDVGEALTAAIELRAHPELPAYPGLRLSATILVPLLRMEMKDRRGVDGALAAAGRTLRDMDRSGTLEPLADALAATLGPGSASREERFTLLRRSIPQIAELPGLSIALDHALAALAARE